MKTWRWFLPVVLAALPTLARLSGEEEAGPASKAGDLKTGASMNAAEKKFADMLREVALVGRWRLVKANNKLGEEAEDSYTIHAVEKLKDSFWTVKARIKYGDKDVTLPVPVEVHWAGDTPVLSVTNKGLPGLGTYTARVLFYDGYYTGTWSGSNHGGFLSGVIVKQEPGAAPEPTK